MKVTEKILQDTTVDVICDVCDESTKTTSGPEFGVLKASWGYGNKHDDERSEYHLCEQCYFRTVAFLEEQRRGLI